jgi:hypothetical protein
MTGGQSTLRSSLWRFREPSQAERRLIVPLSADNRMINLVAVRSFAHEADLRANWFARPRNIPDTSLLMAAMELRQCARLVALPGYCGAAVSCVLPNRRGVFGSKGSEELRRFCGQVHDTKNLPRV